MKKNLFHYFAVILLISFTACNNLDDGPSTTAPRGDYDGGIIVANEGTFGAPNADVSYILPDHSSIDNNIYQAVNGSHAGDVLQHIGFHQDKAFLVLNNSNKIIVVDRFSFEKIDSITNTASSSTLNQPRYIAFAQNKAFVTNAGNQSVQVYDVNSLQHLQSVSLSSTPNQVVSNGQRVFVEQAYFGTGNSVGVIDPGSYAYSSVTLDTGLNGIAMHSNGQNLYAITNSQPTKIHSINTTSLETLEYSIPGVSNARQLVFDNDNLYFASANIVYKAATSNLTLAPIVAVEVPDNSWSTLYGFNVINHNIYTSDVNGFTQNGTVRVYNSAGALLHTFTAGMGPNSFYLNH
ncbi:MAG: hypothetical protein Q4F57_09075 [Weeksellaceae bacterium]|nr:hypothetical protein [Weeksellaceae bacterium]